MSEVYSCPTCHTKSTAYYQRLSPGIVRALIKFKRAVIDKGENSVHLYKDMDGTDNQLTTSEHMNFSKLRQHGLVAKVKVDGQVQRGYWLLTQRGAAFLRGELSVPIKVKTLNNHVIDHDPVHVNIMEVLGSRPIFDDITEIESERHPLDLAQMRLV